MPDDLEPHAKPAAASSATATEDLAHDAPPADGSSVAAASPEDNAAGAPAPTPVVPPEMVEQMLEAVNPNVLIVWLNHGVPPATSRNILKGFSATQRAVQQPLVHKRIIKFLRDDEVARQQLTDVFRASHLGQFLGREIREMATTEELMDRMAQIGGLMELGHSEGALRFICFLEGVTLPEEPAQEEDDAGTVEPGEGPGADLSKHWLRIIDERVLEAVQPYQQKIERLVQKHQKQLAEQKRTHDLERKRLERQLKTDQQVSRGLKQDLQKARRELDREERAHKKAEEETAQRDADIKRLKRQLRQHQELAEQLRRQVAELEARVPPDPPAPQPPPAAPAAPAPAPLLPPERRNYNFLINGRMSPLRPLDVRRNIDLNNEAFVLPFIHVLRQMQQVYPQVWQEFMQAIRKFGPYYEVVLTQQTLRVLVDASNVARYQANAQGKGLLENLLAMRRKLRELNFFPILIFADASLAYNIDRRAEYEEMVRSGDIIVSDSGQEADELITRELQRSGGYAVTNDQQFYFKTAPALEPARLEFAVDDGIVWLEEH